MIRPPPEAASAADPAAAAPALPEVVIVLHGIWLSALTLVALSRRLRAAGYAVEPFGYASVTGGPAPAREALRRRLERHAAAGHAVHLVGHSLGGLIALETARAAPELVRGRVVCLGSPLAGSRSARVLSQRRVTRWMTGKSDALLQAGVAACPSCLTVGVIAGSRPVGLGRFVAGLPHPHDGTVALDETRIDGLAGHCTVMTTHSGLLFSRESARQTLAFLRRGRFEQ